MSGGPPHLRETAVSSCADPEDGSTAHLLLESGTRDAAPVGHLSLAATRRQPRRWWRWCILAVGVALAVAVASSSKHRAAALAPAGVVSLSSEACGNASCHELGADDPDCCAMPGEGGCKDGRVFSAGAQCFENGAVTTCCREPADTPPMATEDSMCALGACLENADPDDDCCALPGQGECAAGYTYLQGEVCFKDFGAVTTCCELEAMEGGLQSAWHTDLALLPTTTAATTSAATTAAVANTTSFLALHPALALAKISMIRPSFSTTSTPGEASTQTTTSSSARPPWALLARQTYPATFSAGEWAKNSDDPSSDNYAILDHLEDFRDERGGFEFKLAWPGKQFQVWRQTSNPVEEAGGGVDGYEAVFTPFEERDWGGLEHGGGAHALLKGSIGSIQWWYAVGTFEDKYGGIPGPNAIVQSVELYVRMGGRWESSHSEIVK